jgi:tRNA-Thr(GGU) m(6)t(6)A37 methyltransferase TsaA
MMTVQAILEAAAELICDLGYANASTNKIAARAGVSIGSLYQYFANKEAILARLLEDHQRQVAEMVERAWPVLENPDVPLTAGLHRLFDEFIALHERNPKLARALSSEVPRPRTDHPKRRHHAARMERLLRQRPDVRVGDPEAAAPVVAAACEALTRWLVHDVPPGRGRPRLVDEMVTMLAGYLAGACAPGAAHFTPIGVVHTPFRSTRGMPIQPSRARGYRGTITVFSDYVDGLADLDGFSHIILLCHFHQARPHRLRVVPYLDDQERGLFATRAPSRPNPIGLSVVRLQAIDGAEVTIDGVDLLDGTPLLDIKPWVGEFDQRDEEVRCGWLDAARRRRRLADDRFAK